MYHGALSDYYIATVGMAGLLTQRPHVPATANTADIYAGLNLTLPALDRAGSFALRAVSSSNLKRRQAALADWNSWSGMFPVSVAPSLATCTPHELIAFLEHWRASKLGRRRPADPEDYIPAIAPSTLQGMASRLSKLCQASGRGPEAWSTSHPAGNPAISSEVTAYLAGYANYCHSDTPYTEAGAVPMSLDLYLRLLSMLISKAREATSPFEASLSWRDATLIAYLWETGQRGKEGCYLLITDFHYADIRCTKAWPDLVDGTLDLTDPLLVESSQGTKTRHSKHPGTLELQTEPSDEDGAGFLVALIPHYHSAMRKAGSPLLQHLFKPSRRGQSEYADSKLESDTFNKRVQDHLKAMGEWSGETLNSIRRGSTQLLRAKGASIAEIGEKRLWRRDTTIELYLHLSRHKARLVAPGPSTKDH